MPYPYPRFQPLPGSLPSFPPPAADGPPSRRWPLRFVLPEAGALLTAPTMARAHVRDVLAQWRLPAFTDDALTVVTELVTNICQQCHDEDGNPVYIGGRLPVFRLSLFSDRAELLIAVFDDVPGVPARQAAADDAETGRGLAMIAELGEWSWQPVDGGKVVRATLRAAA
jgi:hypothetical protein